MFRGCPFKLLSSLTNGVQVHAEAIKWINLHMEEASFVVVFAKQTVFICNFSIKLRKSYF